MSASDCWSGTEFAYYLDPQVSQVAPLTGPRYGSFELRVQLEETVCSFAEEVSLQCRPWAAQYNTCLLIKSKLKGIAILSFFLLSFLSFLSF